MTQHVVTCALSSSSSSSWGLLKSTFTTFFFSHIFSLPLSQIPVNWITWILVTQLTFSTHIRHPYKCSLLSCMLQMIPHNFFFQLIRPLLITHLVKYIYLIILYFSLLPNPLHLMLVFSYHAALCFIHKHNTFHLHSISPSPFPPLFLAWQ